MAKTKDKKWTPRRVRSEDERGGSSDFITLDEGEKFLGYALFEGDPSKDEPGYYEFLQHWVTGMKGGRSVPCAGEDCPFCEEGDKPRDVAFTLWLVTKDEKGNELGDKGEGELRIFRANSLVIKQFTEMRSEDEPIKGQQFRVSRVDDRGNYILASKPKKITASAVKEWAKSKDAPDFDAMVTASLRKAMEGVAVSRAMDDDDDDDDDEKGSKGKKADKSSGKGKGKDKEPEADGEWPTDDELADEEVTVVKVEKEGQWIEVESGDYEGKIKVWTTDDIEFDLSDLSKGDTVTITATGPDDDGDYILSAEPETEEAGGKKEDEDEHADIEGTFELVKVSKAKNFVVVEVDDEEVELYGTDDLSVEEWRKGDNGVIEAEWDSDDECYYLSTLDEPEAEEEEKANLPDAMEDIEVEVVSVDARESTMEVKSDELELEFTLYFLDKGPASKVDFDDYEVGAKITFSAEKDSTGDMVATSIPEVVTKKAGKGGKGAKSSGGKGGKGGKGKNK